MLVVSQSLACGEHDGDRPFEDLQCDEHTHTRVPTQMRSRRQRHLTHHWQANTELLCATARWAAAFSVWLPPLALEWRRLLTPLLACRAPAEPVPPLAPRVVEVPGTGLTSLPIVGR